MTKLRDPKAEAVRIDRLAVAGAGDEEIAAIVRGIQVNALEFAAEEAADHITGEAAAHNLHVFANRVALGRL